MENVQAWIIMSYKHAQLHSFCLKTRSINLFLWWWCINLCTQVKHASSVSTCYYAARCEWFICLATRSIQIWLQMATWWTFKCSSLIADTQLDCENILHSFNVFYCYSLNPINCNALPLMNLVIFDFSMTHLAKHNTIHLSN